MRIAYVAQKFPSLTITFIYREIEALRARGIKTDAFSTWKPRREELSQEAIDLIATTFYVFPLNWPAFLGAHLYYLLTRPHKYIGSMRLLWVHRQGGIKERLRALYHFGEAVYMAREMQRRGVEHIHAGFASNPATLALVIARLTGIHFSFAAHARGIFAESFLMREKLEEARFVITSTRYNKEYLLDQFPGVVADKIKVIYHGVSLQDFEFGAWQQNGRTTILSVAQFQEKKGLPLLIEACRILKNQGHTFECCLVGDGPQRTYLECLIEQYNLHDTVKLAGVIFQEKLQDYYRAADILVLPSIIASDGDRDGIPVALIEAMAIGRPVVSTQVSGIPELVEHGQTGLLVPPGDAEALAEALLTLIRDESLRQQMGRASREKVIRQFSLNDNIAQVAGLFVEEVSLDGKR